MREWMMHKLYNFGTEGSRQCRKGGISHHFWLSGWVIHPFFTSNSMRFLYPLPRALSPSHAPGDLTARMHGPQRRSTAAVLQAGLMLTLPAGPQLSYIFIQPCALWGAGCLGWWLPLAVLLLAWLVGWILLPGLALPNPPWEAPATPVSQFFRGRSLINHFSFAACALTFSQCSIKWWKLGRNMLKDFAWKSLEILAAIASEICRHID